MKPRRSYIILLFICLFDNCKVLTDTKEESEKAIHDLLAIKGDTLVGVKWDSGIIYTTDGGKTWTERANTTHLKKITIDKNRVLWGIDSWIGIHEESYSRLMYSHDLGINWKMIEFNVDSFFPTKLISKPFETLTISTFDDKIYKLVNNKSGIQWSFVDTIASDTDETVYSMPYKIISRSTLVKLNNDGTYGTLITIPDISIPFEMIQSKDTLYIAAGGYGGYKALFATVTNDTVLRKYEMSSVQALGVIKDSKERIWTYGDGGIFLFQKNKLKKMY